jgi:uroporphyrinogen decarboxylase
MNSYERFMTALRREEPDMVPIMDLAVEQEVRDKVMPGVSILDFYEKIEMDAIVVFEDGYDWEEVRPGARRDHFGILRDFREMHGAAYPFPIEPRIKPDQDIYEFLEQFEPPNPKDPKRLASTKAAVDRFKGKKAVVFGMWSSFATPAFLRGYENFLMDYILNPDFAKGLTQKIVDYYVEETRYAIELGADAIIECEDYCSKRAPFMSIPHFREFVLPGLKEIGKVAKEGNVPFLKHADGNMWPLMDIMVYEAEIDGFHPSEPAAGMDIAEVKKKYGDRVAVIGNIDCSQLLTLGTPDEVRKATMECIRSTSPGGGHILSSSNSFHSDVPHENFIAMLETAREVGRYPIKA